MHRNYLINKSKSLLLLSQAFVPVPWATTHTVFGVSDPKWTSLSPLKTYRDSSSCRPNGCRAQGVSKSGSDFGPRQRSVATIASDQTWINERETLKPVNTKTQKIMTVTHCSYASSLGPWCLEGGRCCRPAERQFRPCSGLGRQVCLFMRPQGTCVYYKA